MGLFSAKPPPPLPERADLTEALAQLHPEDLRRLREDKPSRDLLPEALNSELLADTSIVAVIDAFIGGLEHQGPVFVTPGRLFFFTKYASPLTVPLNMVWNLQVAPLTLGLSVGPSKEYTVNLAYSKPESIAFFKRQLKSEIEAAQQQQASNGGSSDAEELERFAKLRDQGILSEEEFQAKKAQILG